MSSPKRMNCTSISPKPGASSGNLLHAAWGSYMDTAYNHVHICIAVCTHMHLSACKCIFGLKAVLSCATSSAKCPATCCVLSTDRSCQVEHPKAGMCTGKHQTCHALHAIATAQRLLLTLWQTHIPYC